MRAYVDFGLHYPHHYYFAFLLPPAAQSEAYASTPTPHEAFDVLRRSVGECRSRGRLRAVDPEPASQSLWAAVHGITSLLIAKPGFPWVGREKLIETVIAMAVDGLDFAPPAAVPEERPVRQGAATERKGVTHG